MYWTTDDPRDIIRELRRLYGRLSPTEREAMDNKWSAPWNTSMSIEHYFKRREEIPAQIHNGPNGGEGDSSNGELWITPNSSE